MFLSHNFSLFCRKGTKILVAAKYKQFYPFLKDISKHMLCKYYSEK